MADDPRLDGRPTSPAAGRPDRRGAPDQGRRGGRGGRAGRRRQAPQPATSPSTATGPSPPAARARPALPARRLQRPDPHRAAQGAPAVERRRRRRRRRPTPTPDADARRRRPTSAEPTEPRAVRCPISGSVELPHWTEPATGEVPKVIIGEGDDDEDAARWAAFADQGPRWRDQSDRLGRGRRVGRGRSSSATTTIRRDVRAPSTPPTARPHEEFLTFDDLEVPPGGLPTAPTRGSLDDPIRISSEPARPPAPPPAPTPTRRRGGRGRRRRSRRARGAPRRRPRTPRPGDGPAERARATPPTSPPPAGRDVPTARARSGCAIAAAGPDPVPLRAGRHHDPGLRRSWPWPGPSSSPPRAAAGSARPRCSAWRRWPRCPWPPTGGASRPSRWCCS